MQYGVTIEQMQMSEKDAVLAFLREAYADNPRQSDEKYWNWHFPESPYCDPNNLPVWLAKVDGRIAGQLAAVPVEFNAAGETVPAIWILDMIVAREFRRRGLAKKLALASLDFCPFVLGVNMPNQHAPTLLKALGWKIFSKIPRYQKILFPGNAVRELANLGPLRSIVNLAGAPLRRGVSRAGSVKIVDAFDPPFDELWREAREQWPCSVSRTAKLLDWQFCRQPGKKFEILAHLSNGELRGYAVMFFRSPNRSGIIEKASISDICYGPADADATLDALLDGAIDLAIQRRVGSIVTDAIDSRLEQRLKRHGFWRVKSDLQLLANVPRNHKAIYQAANWYLTRGDADISFFEAPNL